MSLTARVKDIYFRYFPERDPVYKTAQEEVDKAIDRPRFTDEEFAKAVLELPLQHREALMLHKSGLSSLQIARELGVTEHIARKWLMKAYSEVRMKLKWPDDAEEIPPVAAQPVSLAEHRRRRDDVS